jgi:membrane-bound metal-dependent hydrolase YbcI (DUF457 family)
MPCVSTERIDVLARMMRASSQNSVQLARTSMPFPIAHVLIGATVADQVLSKNAYRRTQTLCAVGALALLPDLDFFFVWVLGLDRSWHRGFTHSIGFGVVAGSLALVLTPAGRRVSLALALAVMSHPLLDWLTTLHGAGVELWWPISRQRFKLSYFGWLEFPPTEFAYASAIEVCVFLPLFFFFRLLRSWLSR